MSEPTVNGHTLDCAWFELARCDCGYDDADDVLDLFLPEDADEGAPA